MSESQEPLRGNDLLRAAWNQIYRHPETWKQESWHCGTSHCFGGWCQLLAGREQNEMTVMDDVSEATGLSRDRLEHITDSGNSLQDIYSLLLNILEPQEPREL